ncbi:coiled-coil domain-containing protein [uncultured Desulfovibrio sp.]|uniref:coiled-coil domain-containing protein n=1 Tax=uncultured Desulfovibrio sp. TaxID=167968 RepID=UPI001C3A2E79|nr:coiled-coil domain-containing protein [uncultured Desulfovibrio sp.]HIX41423.1 CCDC90 family protein [Candidatus Desulfovibrio intestinigallinarum]
MTTTTFDSLGYVRKLEEAGFTRQQAEAQVEAMREQLEAQRTALQRELDKYDEASRRELATKGDVQDVRLEIEKVRAEVERVRAELKTDIEKVKYDLLKWQIGGWLALAAIMAKGFGWLGF